MASRRLGLHARQCNLRPALDKSACLAGELQSCVREEDILVCILSLQWSC